ncbi:hypothetical protein M422DRAFT_98165, partial [Sphaerobolus stellatus SS14]
LPRVSPWLTFSTWQKKYGDIFEVDLLGKSVVIISSAKIAKDLMDKRSSIYSDRPNFIMAGDLTGYRSTFALLPYGEAWRQQRKLISHGFSQAMLPRYYSLQEKEARILVRNLLENPNTLFPQTKLRIATIITRLTYGYYIKDENDPFLTTPRTAMENF